MSDFKLKLVLSILSGILFSFIFIILAFALPVKDAPEPIVIKKPQGKLEKIAESMKNR
ncbi:hypothetical protein [Sulfurimonas sp. C5]|uniref:hypothetical protein n=1 Tax=Sulfurimonas sp. C5 TaxID=3036947 RepID=UPI0024565CD4|nr:hypothetical protein [Sulfurimonas sp. C5]MDH4944182.1 hypothetical protein [Sulfurimonas sp. C5]